MRPVGIACEPRLPGFEANQPNRTLARERRFWQTQAVPAYAFAIFTGAFLLFQVQPLAGKFILPWFGGGPGVWTTCMLFFQVLLLAGYAYAHLSARWLKPRTQVLLHLALVGLALALLPIIPAEHFKPAGQGNPTFRILVLLASTVGLPYFALAATSPLLQRWFSYARPRTSPYRLYALSNIGSLLALVSYPFLFENHFSRRTQAHLWGWGLGLYALACGACALSVWLGRDLPSAHVLPVSQPGQASSTEARPGLWRILLWLLLPACASVLLLATTNKLCLDVAVIPFLWVAPLAFYLLSFVICFDSPRWYARFPFTLALVAALGGLCWALAKGSGWPIWKQIALYCGALFICCMVCHGELYRLRPGPERLTSFYLLVAAGGALGGVLVAVIAPLVFTNYYELHWGMFGCGLLFLLVCVFEGSRRDELRNPVPTRAELSAGSASAPAAVRFFSLSRPPMSIEGGEWRWLACTLPLLAFGALDRLIAGLGKGVHLPKGCVGGLRIAIWATVLLMAISWIARGKFRSFRHWRLLVCLWLSLGVAALGGGLWRLGHAADEEAVFRSRNFYGVLTVYEHRREEPNAHHLLLQHGRITHGLQFIAPDQAKWPVSYYGEGSGVGLAMNALASGPRRIGVVGLGAGTLAAYAEPGDTIRFYEINPEVEHLASSRFRYLAQCRGKVEVVLGDARLSMEREPPQQFDLLALDAFSSDAIPVHLLTREAFGTYERHLKPGGVIAVHISNHFLNLEPVVVNLARHFSYGLALIDYEETEEEWWLYRSSWAILTRDSTILDTAALSMATSPPKTNAPAVPLWTDDFASLYQILQ